MTTRLADALDAAAEALAALAVEYRGEAPTASPDAPGAPSFEDLPFGGNAEDAAPTAAPYGAGRNLDEGSIAAERHGSAAVCPSHAIPYLKGRYGDYCPSTSDDPKWRNAKGYCQITPKSAAAWLRQKAAAG